MSNLNLLDRSIGIQNVMNSLTDQGVMPQAQPLATTVIREAGLDELYNPATAESLLHQALCPDVGDGEMLQPAVFRGNLANSLDTLSMSTDPQVREFIKQDLQPLMDNAELLQAYTGLMVGG